MCESTGDPCGDDGQFCTGTESCNEDTNMCESTGDPCGDDGQFCTGTESCNEDTNMCESTGDPCGDDGLFCTGTESCNEDTNMCESTGDPCGDDGLFCNGNESCDEANGQCVSSGPPDCSAEGDDCNDGVCDLTTDACKASPKADSTPCEDGDFCTSESGTPQDTDHCLAGVCTGVPVDCSDGDGGSCNGDETCNPDGGACNVPDPGGFQCSEICQAQGKAKPKPPKGLEWQYVNTNGDPAFDSVCITAEHPQGALVESQPSEVDDGGFFTTTKSGGNNKKLNPQLTFTICARDGGGNCTENCDASFIVHTSCSLPLGIGEAFPDLGTHDITVEGQIE